MDFLRNVWNGFFKKEESTYLMSWYALVASHVDSGKGQKIKELIPGKRRNKTQLLIN